MCDEVILLGHTKGSGWGVVVGGWWWGEGVTH